MPKSTKSTRRVCGLSAKARLRITQAGLTVTQYVRHHQGDDLDWRGDYCGCTDDRCRGYHHEIAAECGCLPVCIEEALRTEAVSA